jgi:hypothetical protein
MKVAIFETEHFEGAYPVIKLFDNGKNDITIYTIESSYKQFLFLFGKDHDRYSWVIQNKDQSKYNFLWQMYRELKKSKPSIIYMNTIANNFFLYALFVARFPRTRIIITIHAINVYFKHHFAFSLRRIIRYIGRRMLLLVVREFNVVSQPLVSHLQNKLPQEKKVHCIPGAVYEDKMDQAQPPVSQQINLVIPGSVDGRRRDYEQVFLLLEAIENLKIPLRITFLGAFYREYGQFILSKCKAFKHIYTNLKFYDWAIVDQHEFDLVMNQATIVWTPSVITTIIEDGVIEVYGQSIASGNFFDIIKHAKPFLIPSTLKIDDHLEQGCIRYDSIRDLQQFIADLYNEVIDYSSLIKHALDASNEYTIQKVRERNSLVFLNA